MEKLGNFLRENTPKLAKLVEDKFKVDLGTIDVQPFPKFINEINSFYNLNRFEKIICYPLISFLENSYIVAKPGNSTIYYSGSPIFNILINKRLMIQTCLHELGHITHARLAKKNLYDFILNVPKYIREGFVGYVAINIMKEIGMFPSGDRNYKKFQKELDSKGISGVEEVKEYILSFNSSL